MKPLLPTLALAVCAFTTAADATHVQFVGDELYAVSADGRYVVGSKDGEGFRYNVATHAYDMLSFRPNDISGDGSVVVGFDDDGVVTWSGGATTAVPGLSGAFPLSSGDAGTIAGYRAGSVVLSDRSGTLTTVPLPTPNVYRFVNDIANDGTIVGSYEQEVPPHWTTSTWFIYKDGTFTDPASLGLASARAISGDGTAFAGAPLGNFLDQVIVNANGIQSLDSAAAPYFRAQSLNLNGTIAGGSYAPIENDAEFTAAAIWTQAWGAQPLTSVFQLPSTWQFDDVSGISSDGRVMIGHAYRLGASDYTGFIISDISSFSPIPEPATYGWAAALLLGAVLVMKRRGRRAAPATP
jgi:hypothetical protein